MVSDRDGASADEWYLTYGIFNILRDFNVSNVMILLLSMAFGMCLMIVVLKHLKKSHLEDWVFTFSTAALVSVIWFYKSPCDTLVIILCNLMIIPYLKYSGYNIKSLMFVLMYLIGMNWLIGRYFLRFAIQFLTYNQGVFVDHLAQTSLFLIMIGLINRSYINKVSSVFPVTSRRYF